MAQGRCGQDGDVGQSAGILVVVVVNVVVAVVWYASLAPTRSPPPPTHGPPRLTLRVHTPRDTLSSPEGTPSNRQATRTKARATPSSQVSCPFGDCSSSPASLPSRADLPTVPVPLSGGYAQQSGGYADASNSYAAQRLFVSVTSDSSVDLPTEGNPIMATRPSPERVTEKPSPPPPPPLPPSSESNCSRSLAMRAFRMPRCPFVALFWVRG